MWQQKGLKGEDMFVPNVSGTSWQFSHQNERGNKKKAECFRVYSVLFNQLAHKQVIKGNPTCVSVLVVRAFPGVLVFFWSLCNPVVEVLNHSFRP